MTPSQPFLLLRARAIPDFQDEFNIWFHDVHLRDVAKIPGIVMVEAGETAEGTRIGIYTFQSTDTVQSALGSPQAAYSRGTWQRWQPNLEELLIEIWTSVMPMGLYQGSN